MTARYTGDGLRAWKLPTPGAKTFYIYDGSTPVVEMGALGQVSAVNTFGAAGLVSRTNYIGGTVSATVFYSMDAQGSVSQRLDKNGAVLSSSAYDAWGNKVIADGAPDPWGYEAKAGYYTDQETGLILCSHRYYDPSQGRWLNRDPIGTAGGVNVYGYVKNRPMKYMDPTGYDDPDENEFVVDLGNTHGIVKTAIGLGVGGAIALATVALLPAELSAAAIAGTGVAGSALGVIIVDATLEGYKCSLRWATKTPPMRPNGPVANNGPDDSSIAFPSNGPLPSPPGSFTVPTSGPISYGPH